MVRSLVTGIVLGVFASPTLAFTSAEAEQCAVMAETFPAKQAEVLELQALQERLAEETETLGDIWEAAEEFRLFSPQQASEANAAQSAYELSREEFMRVTMDFRSKAEMLNQDIAQFNARCAAD